MHFRILAADTAGAEWSALVGGLAREHRDIHFLPEYGRIYRQTYGYEPLLAYGGDGQGYVIQPFVKRRLDDLDFLKGRETRAPFCDIANAYGYGGPAIRSNSTEHALRLFAAFDQCFLEYCRSEEFASEFVSLHPFLHAERVLAETGLIDAKPQKEIVYMDLTASEAAIWSGLRKGHKSSIKKALRCGIRVRKVEPCDESLEHLNRLYHETMTRNRAAAKWIFPREYFRNCFDNLGERRTSLFLAEAGAVAAAAIVMHDFDTVYYHFSGSDSRYADRSPNNLLVHEIALWAKVAGYARFHLGGGVTAADDDSLLLFKSGFSDRRETLYTYSRVLHQPTYNRLCELKRAHELTQHGAESGSDYFPLYRR